MEISKTISSVTFKFIIRCKKCGKKLSYDTGCESGCFVEIVPCSTCLLEAHEDGYNKGLCGKRTKYDIRFSL